MNYSWVRRYRITAKNLKGALIKISRETGINFKFNGIFYKAKKACIAASELQNDFGDIEKYYTFEEL